MSDTLSLVEVPTGTLELLVSTATGKLAASRAAFQIKPQDLIRPISCGGNLSPSHKRHYSSFYFTNGHKSA